MMKVSLTPKSSSVLQAILRGLALTQQPRTENGVTYRVLPNNHVFHGKIDDSAADEIVSTGCAVRVDGGLRVTKLGLRSVSGMRLISDGDGDVFAYVE